MAEQDERPLFVETTIFIWLFDLDHSKEVRDRIRCNLERRYSITSTYVQAEYLNTFMRTAVDVYNIIADSESLDDAWGRWRIRHAHRRGQRELGENWFFFVRKKDKDEALRVLKEMIDEAILLWFEQSAREISDTTHCEAARMRPHYNGKAYEFTLRFPPEEAPAGLRDFLAQEHALLQRVADDIASSPNDWQKVTDWEKVEDGLSQILSGHYRLGVATWRALSDSIIALESHHHNSEIYTGNVKDFKPVCKAIDLPLKEEHPK